MRNLLVSVPGNFPGGPRTECAVYVEGDIAPDVNLNLRRQPVDEETARKARVEVQRLYPRFQQAGYPLPYTVVGGSGGMASGICD